MRSVVWQPSLWGFDAPATFDPDFTTMVRHQLDSHTWVDHQPGWIRNADALLDSVLTTPDSQRIELLDALRSALRAHYRVSLGSPSVTLLHSGHDPVPWQQHPSGQQFTNPVVATVTLGARRSLRLRPRQVRGGSASFMCASGDLVVQGGAAQHLWDHSVPRNRHAVGPHVRIVFAQSRS